MRIPVIRLTVGRLVGGRLVLGALLGLPASCAWAPPETAAPPPAPVVAVTAPVPLVAPPPPEVAPPPPEVAAVPVEAVSAPPPAREVEYVPVPLLWWRMLTAPLSAGRLMLNNFSFVPVRMQAALTAGPVCEIADPRSAVAFVLPANGTRVIPAPPGFDVCWRRERIAGEAVATPAAGPWTAWNRAYTGPGRFLDANVVTPTPPAVAAAEQQAPAPPPPPGPSS